MASWSKGPWKELSDFFSPKKYIFITGQSTEKNELYLSFLVKLWKLLVFNSVSSEATKKVLKTGNFKSLTRKYWNRNILLGSNVYVFMCNIIFTGGISLISQKVKVSFSKGNIDGSTVLFVINIKKIHLYFVLRISLKNWIYNWNIIRNENQNLAALFYSVMLVIIRKWYVKLKDVVDNAIHIKIFFGQ